MLCSTIKSDRFQVGLGYSVTAFGQISGHRQIFILFIVVFSSSIAEDRNFQSIYRTSPVYVLVDPANLRSIQNKRTLMPPHPDLAYISVLTVLYSPLHTTFQLVLETINFGSKLTSRIFHFVDVFLRRHFPRSFGHSLQVVFGYLYIVPF